MVMNQQSSSIPGIGALGKRASKRWRNEQGFTLIEVIVSIALVLVAGLAAAQFTITAIHTSHAQQQRAAAVSIANGSLEQAEALLGSNKPQDYAKILMKGVTESNSKDAWNTVAGLGAVSADDMDLLYQPASATDTPDSGIKVKRTAQPEESRSGTFTVYTVLGKCYRKQGTAACKSASALGLPTGGLRSDSADVSSQVLSNTDMPTAPFNNGTVKYIPMLRVMVAVTWPDVGGSTKTCVYATSRLIDPNEDKVISK